MHLDVMAVLLTVQAGLVSVMYGESQYPCTVTSLTDGEIYCATEQRGVGSGLAFTVNAGGQSSEPGGDYYSYPTVPEIVAVKGCADSGNETLECNTLFSSLNPIVFLSTSSPPHTLTHTCSLSLPTTQPFPSSRVGPTRGNVTLHILGRHLQPPLSVSIQV